MIACLLIPGFPLRAALLARPRLALRPAALAPVEGTEPLLGPVTAAAAAAGQALVVSDERRGEFLGPLPVELLPLERERADELRELGVRKLGELAGLPGAAVAERLGPDGRRAWSLARGGRQRRVRARKAASELEEALDFPEAVGNELTLRRALAALVERLLGRAERERRFVR